jgi:predicted dehydrogenase
MADGAPCAYDVVARESPMEEIKIAVVGSGARSHAHIQAWGNIPGTKVVACCGRTPEKREKVAARYGLRAYADPREMILREKPDLVHLITYPDSRVPLMTLVSDLGVPMATVEKPLCVNPADWKALSALAARTKTKFGVCHQLRWHPILVKCREALESGVLGAVEALDFTAGMNIVGQGTHILSYAMSLNGDSPVKRVFGNASGWKNADAIHPAPDSSAAVVEFENGVRGCWTTGDVSPRCGDPKTTWQHVRVVAHAEKGRTRFEEFARWEIQSPSGLEQGDFGGMEGFAEKNLAAQTGFHRAMLDWHAGGKPAATNLAQSLHEAKAVFALYASTLWRKPVMMDGFDPPNDLVDELRRSLESG